MTTLINGKETGQTIQTQIKKEVEDLVKKGIAPCLAVILVGEDPASQVYVRNKKKEHAENSEFYQSNINYPLKHLRMNLRGW
jgi:5,10-methylene-tetrahydrofolate dehydrogenase/methenyl tetrahydrofolate cyclohydrolase